MLWRQIFHRDWKFVSPTTTAGAWRDAYGEKHAISEQWLRGGRTPSHVIYPHRRGVDCLAFHGDRVSSCGADGRIFIWAVDAGMEKVGSLLGHTGSITAAIDVPNSTARHLCTASLDCSVRLWDIDNIRSLAVIEHDDWVV